MPITTKELGSQVNDLRKRLGLKPYKDPSKQGAVKLNVELHDLQKRWDELHPATKPAEFTVLEELDEEKLIQPRVPETIKAMSYRLLQHVHGVDPTDGRTVGLLYGTIVALVKKKFPKAQTSLECLRWYAVHMRQEDIKLPQKRPRPLVRA